MSILLMEWLQIMIEETTVGLTYYDRSIPHSSYATLRGIHTLSIFVLIYCGMGDWLHSLFSSSPVLHITSVVTFQTEIVRYSPHIGFADTWEDFTHLLPMKTLDFTDRDGLYFLYNILFTKMIYL